ncbi:MAG TPA: phosphodiester glycosidase family protein, partial [Terriglobia bacterium]|nr:phosphodiester glycosidase family protein [Terriglobia bacterium]
SSRVRISLAFTLAVAWLLAPLDGAQTVRKPFIGVTMIARTETAPRFLQIHIVQIDLNAPGIRFKLTAPGGKMEAIRNTTVEFLSEEHAQVAVNAHFFLPFPSTSADANLIGLAASNGNVYSGFESPAQSYAIIPDAPALNIDQSNRVSIVHRNPSDSDGKHALESVMLWNVVSGSAQIVTDGVKTIPIYKDEEHLDGILIPGGGVGYDNSRSWYNIVTARTAIGITRDNKTLILFTVDRSTKSLGMTVGEIADMLIRDYSVVNALNLDGGGSTTLAMENPSTHAAELVNVPDDSPRGRYVGSNLAVFANPIQK